MPQRGLRVGGELQRECRCQQRGIARRSLPWGHVALMHHRLHPEPFRARSRQAPACPARAPAPRPQSPSQQRKHQAPGARADLQRGSRMFLQKPRHQAHFRAIVLRLPERVCSSASSERYGCDMPVGGLVAWLLAEAAQRSEDGILDIGIAQVAEVAAIRENRQLRG